MLPDRRVEHAPAPVHEQAARDAEPVLPSPGTKVRHDELIRVLGHGGMGTVFLARRGQDRAHLSYRGRRASPRAWPRRQRLPGTTENMARADQAKCLRRAGKARTSR